MTIRSCSGVWILAYFADFAQFLRLDTLDTIWGCGLAMIRQEGYLQSFTPTKGTNKWKDRNERNLDSETELALLKSDNAKNCSPHRDRSKVLSLSMGTRQERQQDRPRQRTSTR